MLQGRLHYFSVIIIEVIIGHEVNDGFKLSLDFSWSLCLLAAWTWIGYEDWSAFGHVDE